MKKAKTKKNRSNPNGANAVVVDPRQAVFLSLYLDPKSETFSNALQSALKAGYTQQTAESLTAKMPNWLSESVGELQMLAKAERNLNTFLELPTKVQAMGAFGPIFEKKEVVRMVKGKKRKVIEKVPVMVENPKLLGHKKDVSIFVAERIGRLRYRKTDPQPGNPGNLPPGTTLVQVNVNEDRERYA